MAPAVALTANQMRWGAWLAPIIVLEGLLLSPVEPLIPGASAAAPPYNAHVVGPVLNLPGPIAMPPGQVNPSRPRARYLMYHQTIHDHPSPWFPDFNSVGVEVGPTSAVMNQFESLSQRPIPPTLPVNDLQEMGVHSIVLHTADLGLERTKTVAKILQKEGCTLVMMDSSVQVYRCPPLL